MEASRFDHLARSLAGGSVPKKNGASRRGVLGGLLGLGASLAGLAGAGAACPPGQVYRQRVGCICQQTGRAPVGGVCPCPRGQSDTGDGQGCLGCRSDDDCPPGTTCGGGGTPNVCGCSLAKNGEFCEGNEACCSGICQGFACVATEAGTCPPGGNVCAGDFFANVCASDACSCYQTPGATPRTVCASQTEYVCATCADDSDCADDFVCVAAVGDGLEPCGCAEGTACVRRCAPDAEGCFVAGTRIAMADGTSRPIENVTAGDAVLGRDGAVNRVLAVSRPRLGNRPLYALNDGAFFVTAGHPFLTEEGWKAIDPAATPIETRSLHVGRLTAGDRLLSLAGVLVPAGVGPGRDTEPVEVLVEPILLERIEAYPADPATPLFNLRLDGDHTYFANDLLVHNKT